MAIQMFTWLFAIPLLGFVTGLRTFTAAAVLCWFAWARHLTVEDTWASWTAKFATVLILTVLALGEYVGDLFPGTPNRTAPGPLVARLITGALVGAIAAAGLNGSSLEGGILAALGALTGAFLGFHVRRELTQRNDGNDWPIALLEDACAILCAILAMGIITG